MTRLALAVLVVLSAACSAPTRSPAVSTQPVLAPVPQPVKRAETDARQKADEQERVEARKKADAAKRDVDARRKAEATQRDAAALDAIQSTYEKGIAALARFLDSADCESPDIVVVVEQIADLELQDALLEESIARFDRAGLPAVRDTRLREQTLVRERNTALVFALADGALKFGCLDTADQTYRRVITYYVGSAYAGIRDRAKLGIDDVRAARLAGK